MKLVLFLPQNDLPTRRSSTPMGTHRNQVGLYSRGQTRHLQSPLMTGITGVSMSISSHPATEANVSSLTSSYNHQYDARGISPVSDEEYDGLKSECTNFNFHCPVILCMLYSNFGYSSSNLIHNYVKRVDRNLCIMQVS